MRRYSFRAGTLLPALALGTLALAASASAHARVSPAVSVANKLQLYGLAVPTEKNNLTTTKVVMTVPEGFGIDSFVPEAPGWHRDLQVSVLTIIALIVGVLGLAAGGFALLSGGAGNQRPLA